MSAESRYWACRVCKRRQESIDYPSVAICELCLRPLAARLCREALGAKLDAEGVDRGYWMHRADGYAGLLLEGWKEGP
jgi:predicted amidophosphoribosyltransferase